jgi:hypothetical protein
MTDPDDRYPEIAGVRDTIGGFLDWLAPYDTEADGQDPEDSP